MGAVTIGHDVRGGSGVGSGFIKSDGKLGVAGGVHIGGSLLGGSDTDSGAIFSGGNMSVVRHSPAHANREIKQSIEKGFDALPADARAEVLQRRSVLFAGRQDGHLPQ